MAKAPTVLVIDDDPSHLKLYSLILAHEGFHVLTAIVGRDAQLELPSEWVDVIVVDYRLGTNQTAVTIAPRLRKSYPGARIAVLSDLQWAPQDITEFAAGFVSKGNPRRLVELVSSLAEHENPSPQ